MPRTFVEPLWSFVSRPAGPIARSPGWPEIFHVVVDWFRGRQPDWRQRVREAKWVDRLAEEIAEAEDLLPAEPEPDNPSPAESLPTRRKSRGKGARKPKSPPAAISAPPQPEASPRDVSEPPAEHLQNCSPEPNPALGAH